jgi:hypothetical protein
MKTLITKQIADRLEELAVQWKDHTSQAEALMMAAKEVMTFQEEEKEQMRLIYEGLLQNIGTSIKQSDLPTFEEYHEQTYGGNK